MEELIAQDRSFTFEIKTPPTSWLLFRAANVDKGSSAPGKTWIGTVSLKHIYEIAKIKHTVLCTKGLSIFNIQ